VDDETARQGDIADTERRGGLGDREAGRQGDRDRETERQERQGDGVTADTQTLRHSRTLRHTDGGLSAFLLSVSGVSECP
jgi:hypothetical protein